MKYRNELKGYLPTLRWALASPGDPPNSGHDPPRPTEVCFPKPNYGPLFFHYFMICPPFCFSSAFSFSPYFFSSAFGHQFKGPICRKACPHHAFLMFFTLQKTSLCLSFLVAQSRSRTSKIPTFRTLVFSYLF